MNANHDRPEETIPLPKRASVQQWDQIEQHLKKGKKHASKRNNIKHSS